MTQENRVVLFSGHMTDAPDRPAPRFPASKEPQACEAINDRLAAWQVGPGSLCLCGGARGGDLVFAEAALARGARLFVYLPMDVDAFVDASVRCGSPDDAAVEARFHAVLKRAEAVDVLVPEQDTDPFGQNNARMIEQARHWAGEASAKSRLRILLLWDGAAGDGPGGTADFARAARETGAPLEIIAPADL